jgi:hypothetical protein
MPSCNHTYFLSPSPRFRMTKKSPMVVGIKDFYLNTPLERYEFMRLSLSMIPNKIIQQYQLQQLVTTDGWVYIEIRKGMYGLKQAGILANQRLQKHLATQGPTPRTPGLWRHATRDVHCACFTLRSLNWLGRRIILRPAYPVELPQVPRQHIYTRLQRGSPPQIPASQPHQSQRCPP